MSPSQLPLPPVAKTTALGSWDEEANEKQAVGISPCKIRYVGSDLTTIYGTRRLIRNHRTHTRTNKCAVRAKASSRTELEKADETQPALNSDALPVTNLTSGLVGWDSQDDPQMPFNFRARQKWTWVWLLSAITLLTPFATSVLSPSINKLDAEFGETNPSIGSLTVSAYIFGYIVGPPFIGPLSEIYGRKWVLTGANAFFCLWLIGCALAPNIETLIVSRFLSGIGGVAVLSLGGSIIGDLFPPETRGRAMGCWNIGPLFGPIIGPVAGAFTTQYIGWRWDFWIVLIASIPVALLIAICTRETGHKVLMQRKTAALQKELGRKDLISCYDDDSHLTTVAILRNGFLRPLKLIFLSPIVFFLSLYIAFLFGVNYLLYTTIPTVFEDTYGFKTGKTGLPYVALGGGNIVAWLTFTIFSDRWVKKLKVANGGMFTPEMRLILSIPFGFMIPITLFWYGWSSFYKLHVLCTIFSLVPIGMGMVGLFLPLSTYLVDSYPLYAASATSANVIVRSLAGATLPLAGPPLYSRLGLGWGNSLLGFVSLLMVPLPLIFYKFGARLRAAQKFKL